MATDTENRLQAYLDAEAKILRGQSVRMGDRQLQRADLKAVQDQIRVLQRDVALERRAAGGRGGSFVQADFG